MTVAPGGQEFSLFLGFLDVCTIINSVTELTDVIPVVSIFPLRRGLQNLFLV
jgi:hypothetical protein